MPLNMHNQMKRIADVIESVAYKIPVIAFYVFVILLFVDIAMALCLAIISVFYALVLMLVSVALHKYISNEKCRQSCLENQKGTSYDSF